jgi:DNA-3-methyladenine glycosylase I
LPVPFADSRPRCPWSLGAPELVAYHDDEWGRPVRGDTALFERLSLEAFQSGLSWLTILRKRPAFRAAFAGFEPAVVAAFDASDVERLLADTGIVRNRAKILATVHNAQAVLALQAQRGHDALDGLVWAHAARARAEHRPATRLEELPAATAASRDLAAALRAVGFRFVGPTTAYAAMQACGLVDDHLVGCIGRGRYEPP